MIFTDSIAYKEWADEQKCEKCGALFKDRDKSKWWITENLCGDCFENGHSGAYHDLGCECVRCTSPLPSSYWNSIRTPRTDATLKAVASRESASAARRFMDGEISAGKLGELLGLEPGELHDFKNAIFRCYRDE